MLPGWMASSNIGSPPHRDVLFSDLEEAQGVRGLASPHPGTSCEPLISGSPYGVVVLPEMCSQLWVLAPSFLDIGIRLPLRQVPEIVQKGVVQTVQKSVPQLQFIDVLASLLWRRGRSPKLLSFQDERDSSITVH